MVVAIATATAAAAAAIAAAIADALASTIAAATAAATAAAAAAATTVRSAGWRHWRVSAGCAHSRLNAPTTATLPSPLTHP